ncbi:hypothetical protein STRDD11_01792 [Streptococcus sp. DD11]|nr:hypothetical protein STRDD11_01792 [Streptococcus sp. DD11]
MGKNSKQIKEFALFLWTVRADQANGAKKDKLNGQTIRFPSILPKMESFS